MPIKLDTKRRSTASVDFEHRLRDKVVGQPEALEKVSEVFQMYKAGLTQPFRPMANLLFLGPTGTGKTRTAEAVAEALFGDSKALIRVDCAEFQHSHEIAKLIGSPPGYLGHRETHPLLTQDRLDEHHTPSVKVTVLLFDEIEKASDSLWKLLLGIMDKGTLTLGDNKVVDFSRCIIFLSSNCGAAEMQNLTEGSLGFRTNDEVIADSGKLAAIAKNAAKSKFSPEFMNRIDRVVVFNTLEEKHYRQIIEIELATVQTRILLTSGTNQFVFKCTDAMKDLLLKEGFDRKYNARNLKRAIEKNIVFAIANLISTDQISLGDFLTIDYKDGEVEFTKDEKLEGGASALVTHILNKHAEAAAATTRRSGERHQYNDDYYRPGKYSSLDEDTDEPDPEDIPF